MRFYFNLLHLPVLRCRDAPLAQSPRQFLLFRKTGLVACYIPGSAELEFRGSVYGNCNRTRIFHSIVQINIVGLDPLLMGHT
jgi:hypothetical protein